MPELNLASLAWRSQFYFQDACLVLRYDTLPLIKNTVIENVDFLSQTLFVRYLFTGD